MKLTKTEAATFKKLSEKVLRPDPKKPAPKSTTKQLAAVKPKAAKSTSEKK